MPVIAIAFTLPAQIRYTVHVPLRLPDESSYADGRYDDPTFAKRRSVLRETVAAFEQRGDALRAKALANLERWRAAAGPSREPKLQVHSGDWGDVTAALTKRHGRLFAALNMANAFHPGGAYREGTAAQEENMFRRTDCHFSVAPEHLDGDRYTPAMTDLVSGRHGRVLLDTRRPRTLIRGAEDRKRDDLGYRWLRDDELCPFVELRAAAVDLRGGKPFDADETRRRIAAQLETLIAAGLRHAVLGAFGCGAFHNPAIEVALLYREELRRRERDFDLVAFAIFDAGYGPDNHSPFAAVFDSAFDVAPPGLEPG